MAVAHAPEAIKPGVVDREDIGRGTRYFEFLNPSPYYVLVRFDFAETSLDAQPEHVIAPYTNQRVQTLDGPKDKLCWKASDIFPKSPNPTAAPERFGFIATDAPIQASPASVLSVGVQDAPQTKVEAPTNVASTALPNGSAFITSKADVDTALRFILYNNGNAAIGPGGTTAAEQLWRNGGPGLFEFLQSILLPAQSANPAAAIRRDFLEGYAYAKAETYTQAQVDAGLNGRVSKSGDSMSGNLSVGVSSSLAAHVMRRDEIFNELVKRIAATGDTMTGNLVLAAGSTQAGHAVRRDEAQNMVAAHANSGVWVAQATAGYSQPRAVQRMIDDHGTVYFRGSIQASANIAAGTTIATLPTNFAVSSQAQVFGLINAGLAARRFALLTNGVWQNITAIASGEIFDLNPMIYTTR